MIRPPSIWRTCRKHNVIKATRVAPISASTGSSYSSDRKVLQHHHLSGDKPDGIVPYGEAHSLQEQLRSGFLSWKSQTGLTSSEDCPRPHLISFESTPTFTLGRRQDDLTVDQTARLCRDLQVNLSNRLPAIENRSFVPEVRNTNRGGLTTYHGPGQIVFWPVLDMHSPLYPRFGVASYASHLESTTRRLLARLYGIRTYTNPDEPGVWVTTAQGQTARKIAALGVHHRRHVTALGIALNIDIPVSGGEDVNSWSRFVPCGLDGKLVTSVAAELDRSHTFDIHALANVWAEIFEDGLVDSAKRDFTESG